MWHNCFQKTSTVVQSAVNKHAKNETKVASACQQQYSKMLLSFKTILLSKGEKNPGMNWVINLFEPKSEWVWRRRLYYYTTYYPDSSGGSGFLKHCSLNKMLLLCTVGSKCKKT